ncbi:glycoside hydrolase family 97 protein [Massilia cellulosiltytica]|uniref:glycoside hydrolase family 97 protein n=1 Tax=Massilia cellulosiltytica TaxID=2683234 RepID=UPI0039B3E50B
MNIRMLTLAVLAAFSGAASAASAGQVAVTSPNGRAVIKIARDGGSYVVTRGGETVIAASPLGLEFDGQPDLGALVLEKVTKTSVDRAIPLVATKASSARDHYRAATLQFRDRTDATRRLLVDVRAYDDGVAFRYRIDGGAPVRLRGEKTGFMPAGDPDCLISVFDGAHEVPFARRKITQLDDKKGYDVPVVCTTPSGRTAYAITQADLGGYTGVSLWRDGAGLRVQLSPVPGRAAPVYASQGGLQTAWRVVMLGNRPGDLIASNLVGNLNPAPQGDFSWVKPGKAAWDWWSGPLMGMKPDMAAYRRFIDFAAASGFPYYLIDAGWSKGANADAWVALPTTDITRTADGIDMPELVSYAASKGVGLILWAHWDHVRERMDEVLDTYARWGIKGVKIDFMSRDDQDVVEFYERVARATAQRHLLLDLHGAYVPAGLQRTYPNFITQEGVLGAEWDKMKTFVTPEHNLMLPYTRMLAGPLDYTPGGFRNVTPAAFQVRAELPFVPNTRGQELAKYVVYDSPLQMVSDDPDAYRDAEGFDFIRKVPTAWDETRFLSGEPGKDIVLARRLGTTWYVGAMSADEGATTKRVPLDFLPAGRYKATIWEDGATPNNVKLRATDVTPRDALALELAGAGGAVVILEAR